MRRAAAILVLAAAATVAGSSTPTHGHHGKPYSANVREARQWLRAHTHPWGFRCADRLFDRESGWNPHARGPMTRWGRAGGIPQAVPFRKMAVMGRGWRTDATKQVIWGTRYVRARYGSFCHALRFNLRHSWY